MRIACPSSIRPTNTRASHRHGSPALRRLQLWHSSPLYQQRSALGSVSDSVSAILHLRFNQPLAHGFAERTLSHDRLAPTIAVGPASRLSFCPSPRCLTPCKVPLSPSIKSHSLPSRRRPRQPFLHLLLTPIGSRLLRPVSAGVLYSRLATIVVSHAQHGCRPKKSVIADDPSRANEAAGSFVVTLPAFASLGGQPTCVRACGCHFISPAPRLAAEARRARHLRPMVGRGKDALIPPNLSWQAHAWLRCRHPAGLGAKLFVSAFPSTHPRTLTLAVHALSSPRSHARRVELRLACNGDQRVCSPSGTEAVWRTKQAQPFSPLASVSARTQALALGASAERHGLLVASTEIGPGQDPVICSSRSVLCMLAAGEIAPTQCIVEWALRPRALWQLLPRCSPDASPTSLAHTAPALARRPFACRASPFPHRRTRPPPRRHAACQPVGSRKARSSDPFQPQSHRSVSCTLPASHALSRELVCPLDRGSIPPRLPAARRVQSSSQHARTDSQIPRVSFSVLFFLESPPGSNVRFSPSASSHLTILSSPPPRST